jgi:hypothetical protein
MHVKRRTAEDSWTILVAMRTPVLLAVLVLASAAPVRAQDGVGGEPRIEIVVVPAPEALPLRSDDAVAETSAEVTLTAGERIAVRVESGVEVGDREVGPGPVADAAVGEVIARFGSSGAFAWPERPTVWIAPEGGALTFDVNAYPAHRARGAARIEVLRLGGLDAPAPRGFEPPVLQLDRVPGGVRARWSDRAGYGVEPATLLLELTTSHQTVYRLDPWVRPGPNEVTLPLPPPGLALPPGIHTLTATIEDRLGVQSPPSTIRFDTP